MPQAFLIFWSRERLLMSFFFSSPNPSIHLINVLFKLEKFKTYDLMTRIPVNATMN